MNSFEFDAPKWRDFSKPSYTKRQENLIDFFESTPEPEYSFVVESDPNDSISDISSSWFEYPHPEHELVSNLTDCNLDSPNLLRKKFGPPIRKLPLESFFGETSLSFSQYDRTKLVTSPILGSCQIIDPMSNSPTTNSADKSEELYLSPLFTPINPKRMRRYIQSPTSTSYNMSDSSKDLTPTSTKSTMSIYSPNALNWMNLITTSPFSLSEHTSTSLNSPSFLNDSFFSSTPGKTLDGKSITDEYIENDNEENAINMAPVSKLLQAFLNKKHHNGSIEPQDTPQVTTVEPNIDSKDNDRVIKMDLDKQSFQVPPKNTLCFATIQKKLATSQKIENTEKVKTESKLLVQDNNHLFSGTQQKNKQNPILKPIKPPWNPVGIASVHKKLAQPKESNVDELFSMLAEHNAKIKRPQTKPNINAFSTWR